MRPIQIARLEKSRPALILTRAAVRDAMSWVTVAPITSTIRGLATELRVGAANGLDHESVVSCDHIQTIPATSLARVLGFLHEEQEAALADAIASAFDLRIEALD